MNSTNSFNVPEGALGTLWRPRPAAYGPNGKPQHLIIDPPSPLSDIGKRIAVRYAGLGIELALARPHPRTGRPQDTHRAGSWQLGYS